MIGFAPFAHPSFVWSIETGTGLKWTLAQRCCLCLSTLASPLHKLSIHPSMLLYRVTRTFCRSCQSVHWSVKQTEHKHDSRSMHPDLLVTAVRLLSASLAQCQPCAGLHSTCSSPPPFFRLFSLFNFVPNRCTHTNRWVHIPKISLDMWVLVAHRFLVCVARAAATVFPAVFIAALSAQSAWSVFLYV